MIIVLSVVLTIVVMLLLGCLGVIKKLQDQIVLLDKEQHTQNKDILDLIKYKVDSTSLLIQHSEILKYLVDEDAKSSTNKIKYTGVVGEA